MIRANDKPELGAFTSDYSVMFCFEHMTVTVSVYVEGNDGDTDYEIETLAVKLADKIVNDSYGFSPMELCQEWFADYCGAVL